MLPLNGYCVMSLPGSSGPGTESFGRRFQMSFSVPTFVMTVGNVGPAFFCVSVPQAGGLGRGDTLGLCIVAPFVQTHSTKQHFLSARLLMLVIMVVTGRDFQP